MQTDTNRHGFLLLIGQGVALRHYETERGLMGLGFGQFRPDKDNGRPALVVLDTHATKANWFEAGYWVGAGVPLFVIGGPTPFKKRHIEAVNRLGGWMVGVTSVADLLAAVVRRGLKPTTWDAVRVEETMAAIAESEAKKAELQ
jgi:hypothetical protein